MGPDDTTRRAALHRAGRRARRVPHPQGLYHHGEHLVSILYVTLGVWLTTARKALHARSRSLQGPHGVQPGPSDREAWQARRARSVHLRIWIRAPVSFACMQIMAVFVTSYVPNSACPGEQLAQSIMFIFAATVLSVFDINKVTVNGVIQEPTCEFSSGVLVYVFFLPASASDGTLI